MKTVGILHGALQANAQTDIDQIEDWLKTNCKTPPAFEVPSWSDNLATRAKTLIQKKVDVLLAAGGSRAAHAAINARGVAKTPIIVFTSVAPYIIDEIKDKKTVTGVCAHTSDHDGIRLGLLLDFLKYSAPTIGVLWNSNRGDTATQWQTIKDAADQRCSLVGVDLNGPPTVKDAFNTFKKKSVDGLLVAADPLFHGNRPEVIDRANKANYPAIYQWSTFVDAGGLMSYGLNRDRCYAVAQQMVADILDGGAFPDIWQPADTDYELVVRRAKATHFGRWPLPPSFNNHTVVLF